MSCEDTIVPPLSENRRLVLVVAAVLIDHANRVLLAQRPEGKSMAGLWEFPGGKMGDLETPEAALQRELKEELGIEARAGCFWPLTFASHSYPDFHLLMPIFVCRMWTGEVIPQEGQAIAWVSRHGLKDYPMPPADTGIVQILWDYLGSGASD